MIPPTSIDGTDITGATIDGTDVTEITVDGQTVFSAAAGLQDIVAPANLVSWYPFTNQALDETRSGGILDNAGITVGDSNDYSGTNVTATYQPNGGVFDLSAGANSGDYDFTDDRILTPNQPIDTGSITIALWVNNNDPNAPDNGRMISRSLPGDYKNLVMSTSGTNQQMEFLLGNGSSFGGITPPLLPQNVYSHIAMTGDNGTLTGYIDGQPVGTASYPTGSFTDQIGIGTSDGRPGLADGQIDDVRHYNRALTNNEINQIYQNTKP